LIVKAVAPEMATATRAARENFIATGADTEMWELDEFPDYLLSSEHGFLT